MSVFRFHAPMRAPAKRSRGTSATDDEHLFQLVKQIDLRDGKLDGRSKKPTQRCSGCKRVVSARTGACLDCGAMASRKSLF